MGCDRNRERTRKRRRHRFLTFFYLSCLSCLQHSFFPQQFPIAPAISMWWFSTSSLHAVQQRSHYSSPSDRDAQVYESLQMVGTRYLGLSCNTDGLFLLRASSVGTGCSSLWSQGSQGALGWLWPWGIKKWAHPVCPSCQETHPSLGEGDSSHLFKRLTMTCNNVELLHLWHSLCCSTIILCSISVLSASRRNTIKSTFFCVKPASTFSLTTRQTHHPIVFRPRPPSNPWECWCYCKWSIATSQCNCSWAETLDLQP